MADLLTLDLFADAPDTRHAAYRAALHAWFAQARRDGLLRQGSSIEVYEHMWMALADWAVAQGRPLDELTPDDFDAYLASRGGRAALTPRYAWRLLRLAERVLAHHATRRHQAANEAPALALRRRPALRFANAAHNDAPPEHLRPDEASRLVRHLAVRPRADLPWQALRNRTGVALMLGAGLTPGELRALSTSDVRLPRAGSGTPCRLQVPASASTPARETPVAPWATRLLRRWLEQREALAIPGPMLLPSTRSSGKPWGKVAQYNATAAVLAEAGLADVTGGSFRLRHTFALRQLRRGTAEHEVARWLGVSDPAVMARYRGVLAAPR